MTTRLPPGPTHGGLPTSGDGTLRSSLPSLASKERKADVPFKVFE